MIYSSNFTTGSSTCTLALKHQLSFASQCSEDSHPQSPCLCLAIAPLQCQDIGDKAC